MKSKGRGMDVTLSDESEFDDSVAKFEDKKGNYMAFTFSIIYKWW